VSERQAVEHGNAEPSEPALEHVLERLRPRRRREVVPLAARELADDHAADTRQLARLFEVQERPVKRWSATWSAVIWERPRKGFGERAIPSKSSRGTTCADP
jgi:hypothetical protein